MPIGRLIDDLRNAKPDNKGTERRYREDVEARRSRKCLGIFVGHTKVTSSGSEGPGTIVAFGPFPLGPDNDLMRHIGSARKTFIKS
jgi:hypothetical protein